MKRLSLLLIFVITSLLLHAQFGANFTTNEKEIEKRKKQERIKENANNGWEYIGEIDAEITEYNRQIFNTLELYVKVIQGQKFYQVINKSGATYSVTKNPDYNGARWYEKTKWYHKYTHMAGNTAEKYYFSLNE